MPEKTETDCLIRIWPDSGLGFQVEVLKNFLSCTLFAQKRKGGGAGFGFPLLDSAHRRVPEPRRELFLMNEVPL